MQTTPIPHPPRLPFIGNLHQLAGENILQKFIDIANYHEEIVELKVLGFKLVFVNSVELAKELMDETRFQKYLDIPIQNMRKIAGDALFTAWTHEPNWQKAHNILMPGFAHQAILSYIPIMQGVINQLLDFWAAKGDGAYVDVQSDMTRLTFDVIGLCGFDYSFNCFGKEEQHPFIDAMLFSLDDAIRQARVPSLLKPLCFKRNSKFKESIEYMNDLIDKIIQKRRANPEQYTDKTDFLQLMLHSTDKDTGEKLSDENIRQQIITFLIAGHETTSGLLSFALLELVRHPDYLEKARTEALDVLGEDLSQTPRLTDIRQLRFINQVLHETLRLYPPVISFAVATDKPTTIGKQNYVVEPKTALWVFSYNIHRDKKHWGENPEDFNPDNFAPKNILQRDKAAFKAFGNGKRSCIGQHFALMEASLALAMILRRFDLEINDDYQLAFDTTITMRPADLKIKLTERK